MRGTLAYLSLFISGILCAQDLAIKKIELDGEKVYLTFDLADSTRDRVYTVNLYTSNDNFITPLKNLKGDYGLEVRPGNKKLIEWNAREEFGADFDGSVSFELRAKVYTPFIRLESFEENKKFVRGRSYDIYWRGGRPQNVLNFQLLKGETLVHTFSNIGNEGKYALILPIDTKPGNTYRFRISDSKNKDEIVNTTTFKVIRKIPLLYKVISTVVVGGVLYIILNSEDNCKDCLPEFPGAPSN